MLKVISKIQKCGIKPTKYKLGRMGKNIFIFLKKAKKRHAHLCDLLGPFQTSDSVGAFLSVVQLISDSHKE